MPVIGLVGALVAWQAAHAVGRRVCGMAYGVPERITTNGFGFLWAVVGTIVALAAGALLTAHRRVTRIVGLVLLGLFVVGTVALPLLATGSCEGIGQSGRVTPVR